MTPNIRPERIIGDQTSYRESHVNQGYDYDQRFNENPYRALMWELERRVLLSILQEHFPTHKPTVLDFACGTGRIVSFLEEHAHTTVGVDVSESMLRVARKRVTASQLHQCDITRTDALVNNSFDLITAFRFFPNAENILRREAMNKLTELLLPNGILVFNNHENRTSLVRTIGRSIGKYKGKSMSTSEVEDLVKRAGLYLETCFPLGVLPFNEKWCPSGTSILKTFEVAASKVPFFRYVAQNIIYVCRKPKE